MTIYDAEDLLNPNAVLTNKVITDETGHYSFSLDRSGLPQNASYMISIDADSLLITRVLNQYGCPPIGVVRELLPTTGSIGADLKIDFPAFLQITFDKLDHATDERINLTYSYFYTCVLLESTIEKPDTTFFATFHFNTTTIDIQYQTFDEGGTTGSYSIEDILLLKNDTVKMTIEY